MTMKKTYLPPTAHTLLIAPSMMIALSGNVGNGTPGIGSGGSPSTDDEGFVDANIKADDTFQFEW